MTTWVFTGYVLKKKIKYKVYELKIWTSDFMGIGKLEQKLAFESDQEAGLCYNCRCLLDIISSCLSVNSHCQDGRRNPKWTERNWALKSCGRGSGVDEWVWREDLQVWSPLKVWLTPQDFVITGGKAKEVKGKQFCYMVSWVYGNSKHVYCLTK